MYNNSNDIFYLVIPARYGILNAIDARHNLSTDGTSNGGAHRCR